MPRRRFSAVSRPAWRRWRMWVWQRQKRGAYKSVNAVGARTVVLERYGPIRIERVELPGRTEKIIVVRGFAAHVSFADCLDFLKKTYWGRDPDEDDVVWLTQWRFIDWDGLCRILGSRDFGDHVRADVERGGFGQLRWYGAKHETSRHADGFDGFCDHHGEQILGQSRFFLRLGGTGYLTYFWERRGGPPGKHHLLLRHGDMVLQDRACAGASQSGMGISQQERLRMTHRAGGLAAKHAPRRLLRDRWDSSFKEPKSFVTLLWTVCQSRQAFLCHLERFAAEFSGMSSADSEGLNAWPEDPADIAASLHHALLLPWRAGLVLKERQHDPSA
eukprot:TRINITY_DN21534_c1_g1_i1.p1 TRINITY_DN21534_c1_g1~~TRINITY_DN21534_c1_g1_i1.p1  ORF type:complete len:331 (-),score=22.76 TRINITY_DN21534_c1_g1_i1:58-1050(-)